MSFDVCPECGYGAPELTAEQLEKADRALAVMRALRYAKRNGLSAAEAWSLAGSPEMNEEKRALYEQVRGRGY
jgi:hypothetical protein